MSAVVKKRSKEIAAEKGHEKKLIEKLDSEIGLSKEESAAIERMTPMTDVLARVIFKDKDLVEHLINLIPGCKNVRIERVETQADLKRLGGARSLELDVWAKDTDQTQYNLEFQTNADGAPPRRLRYHGSGLDVEVSRKGNGFQTLPDLKIIFVTTEAMFEDNCLVHTFVPYDKKHKVELDAGIMYICINAAGEPEEGEERLSTFARDCLKNDPAEMETEILAKNVRDAKYTAGGRKEMSDIMKALTAKAVAEAAAEATVKAQKEARYQFARNLWNDGEKSTERISLLTDLTEEEVLEAIGQKTA